LVSTGYLGFKGQVEGTRYVQN